jgi:hypothetical protein
MQHACSMHVACMTAACMHFSFTLMLLCWRNMASVATEHRRQEFSTYFLLLFTGACSITLISASNAEIGTELTNSAIFARESNQLPKFRYNLNMNTVVSHQQNKLTAIKWGINTIADIQYHFTGKPVSGKPPRFQYDQYYNTGIERNQ